MAAGKSSSSASLSKVDEAELPLDQGFLTGQIGHMARLAFAAVRVHFQKCVNDHGLSPGDFAVLSLLHGNPDTNQRRLAEAIYVSPPNLAVVLDRLGRRGLIQRNRNPADKRTHVLRLTEAGESLYEEAARTVDALETEAASVLAPAERAELLRLLRKVADR